MFLEDLHSQEFIANPGPLRTQSDGLNLGVSAALAAQGEGWDCCPGKENIDTKLGLTPASQRWGYPGREGTGGLQTLPLG